MENVIKSRFGIFIPVALHTHVTFSGVNLIQNTKIHFKYGYIVFCESISDASKIDFVFVKVFGANRDYVNMYHSKLMIK